MTVPRCKSCPYWEHFDGTGKHSTQADLDLGACRRWPPLPLAQVMPHRLEVRGGEGISEGRWIDTHAEDWCGEHPDFPTYLGSLPVRP